MALPKMTPEQMAEMQKKAKASREAQAKAIEDVKTGGMPQFEKLLQTEDKALKKIRIKRLMLALPGIGAKGFETFCETQGIDPTRRIGGLGTRQKEVLTQRAQDAFDK